MVKALRPRPSFAEIIKVIEEIKEEAWASFHERRGDYGRELALYLGRGFAGLTLTQLQAEVKAGTAMAVSSAIRRFKERLCNGKPLRKLLARAMKAMRNR